jgi:catechol 2,3-dioxygenase-like lactoylglutathione lyase family enzyme
MPMGALNHYFVRANNLEETKNFYCDVLGFEEMPRPNFPFPGYWLGAGGQITVHMGPHGIPNSELYYLGTKPTARTDQTGVVDHIAFLATEPKEFIERFKSMGMPYRPRFLSESSLYQLFVTDPNGLVIELNFWGITDTSDFGDSAEDYSKMARVETV